MASARRNTTTRRLLSILLLAAPILAKYQNNFDLYPSAAQPCLYASSDASKCDGNTVATMNKCLCSDDKGKFVTNSATCLGKEAKDTLRTVYQSMSTACSDSKTPISMTEDQFLNLGAQGATASLSVTLSTSTTASPTTFLTTTTGGATVTLITTPTPTTSAAPEEDKGLSTTAKIGVGVGAGVGAIALVCLAVFIWRIKKSRDAHDESHRPMLGGGIGATGHNNPQHGPFTEYSPPTSIAGAGAGAGAGYAAYNGAQEYKNETKQQQSGWRPVSEVTQTTSPGGQTWATNSPQPPYAQFQSQQQQSLGAWGHHPQAAYVPPPQEPPQQEGVFELASIPAASQPASQVPQPLPGAVEMPATEVQPQPARYQYPSQRQ
ncbi:hypothetical protein CORC01_09791 [Colletotrichum orchidophilum]|uniref:Extracellular membrane protein CFEM domain-containing protein n=1 Tax=Colletotrichum orchidophilum TaxID=1209926 RepID=A0A1G4B0P4_9PEZI|nr:uncharacterized protein CORC01_09791 [Colletotrichum orchidophilum]OHE94872.1 hypothetical protein CORC01_09791 [Colletotrichum orchidophilum]